MKVIFTDSEEQMSEVALNIVLGTMYQAKHLNISLTSGRSPLPLYKLLAPAIKGKPEFKNIDYWWFDDSPYVGQDFGKNYDEMKKILSDPAELDVSRIHHPNLDNYTNFDEMIDRAGGIDLMVIGLGTDGHFCGNLKECTPMDALTYKVDFNEMAEKFPEEYSPRPKTPYLITMGPASLMRVKHLVMIVNTEEKAEIFKRFLEEEIHKENPSTILRLHPNFTVVVDKDAAKLIDDITKYQ